MEIILQPSQIHLVINKSLGTNHNIVVLKLEKMIGTMDKDMDGITTGIAGSHNMAEVLCSEAGIIITDEVAGIEVLDVVGDEVGGIIDVVGVIDLYTCTCNTYI